MKTNIIAKHIEISPEIKEYIKKEAEKLNKYHKQIYDCKVIINYNNKRYDIEITLSVKKHTFVASDESFDLMTSIDNVFKKIKKQFVKYEKRIHEHKGK